MLVGDWHFCHMSHWSHPSHKSHLQFMGLMGRMGLWGPMGVTLIHAIAKCRDELFIEPDLDRGRHSSVCNRSPSCPQHSITSIGLP